MDRLRLLECLSTRVEFPDHTFTVSSCGNGVRIALSDDDFAVLTQKSQQVPYKATILGSVVLAEEKHGTIDYGDLFAVEWSDEHAQPELTFKVRPKAITRRHDKQDRIELGMEEVTGYHISYDDGVEADFDRNGTQGFDFEFSTGFYGSFEEIGDGSYTLTFKGDRLGPDEDEYRSQSKFIVSRSKYTGRLLLILQDQAAVTLKLG